jgi:hypothetical protein
MSMNKKAQEKPAKKSLIPAVYDADIERIETRGRKKNPRGPILSNGLFKDQWDRLSVDAAKQGIDTAVLMRRAIDWYYNALEKQEGILKEDFEKLELAPK